MSVGDNTGIAIMEIVATMTPSRVIVISYSISLSRVIVISYSISLLKIAIVAIEMVTMAYYVVDRQW